ncbi:MAG: L-2-amino-thiazoline-4-carboxylic acid hydrolase [Actinomycetota bacterium]
MAVERNRPKAQDRTRQVSKRRTDRLVRRFDRYLGQSIGVLVDRFGEKTAAVMRGEILDEYRRLIPELPYIGGWRNSHSGSLSLALRTLALYRVVVRHGGSLEDTGELLHRSAQTQLERVPRVVRHGVGRYKFTKLSRWRLERAARKSQARRYPGDWVFERIDGDGETFDFGMDTTECGIVKFLHTQEADELGPYLCDLDYVMYEAMGCGLRRTKTLAWGCDRCDFRYSKQGVTSAPWPPEFVERTCGQPQP